jgi:hypothetical protein
MAANAIRDDGDDMVGNVDVVGALGAILVKGLERWQERSSVVK